MNEIIEELNNNIRTMVYDIIYNHSILSSLSGTWNNFHVQSWGNDNTKNHVLYRQFRVNLHGLMVGISSFLDNILMRLYLLNSMTFSYQNINDSKKLEKLRGMMCDDTNSDLDELCDLVTEYWRFKEFFNNIRGKFNHLVQANNAVNLATILIQVDPDTGKQILEEDSILTTLDQYLESIVRLFHTMLDLQIQVEIFEDKFDLRSFSNLLPNIKGALRIAHNDLRNEARHLDPSWDELHVRLKNASY